MNKKKFGAKTRKILKEYWWHQKSVTALYWQMIDSIESEMQKATKIPTVEFFRSDEGIVGIGTSDRKMELLQEEDLECEHAG